MAIHAAAGGGDWATGASWDGGVAPSATDDAVLDATSGPITVNTTTCVCKTLTCTGYTQLLTFTAAQKLTVSGSVTFAATHTLAGTGILEFNANATWTTAGLTFPGSVNLAGTTLTLAADTTATGTLTSVSGTNVLNGNTMYVGGSLTCTVALSGTTAIEMNGTGTISSPNANAYISNNLTINTAGTITCNSFYYKTGTLTWTTGTYVSGGSLYLISSSTLNTSTITWLGIVIYPTSLTITLLSELKMQSFNFTPGVSVTMSGNYNITCSNLSTAPSYNLTTGLTLVAGTTLTVSTGLFLAYSGWGSSVTGSYLKSGTASSSAYLIYQGTPSNCYVVKGTFTDIDASGSAQEIKNYNGGTLTRCTNIRNVNLPVIPSASY